MTKIPMFWTEKDNQKRGFGFDKCLEIFDKRFYFEVETGSQFHKRDAVIPHKIKNYMKLEGKFHVVFIVADSQLQPEVTAKRYGQEILNYISRAYTDYYRGSQFLVSPYEGLVNDPLGQWLINVKGQTFSFQSV